MTRTTRVQGEPVVDQAKARATAHWQEQARYFDNAVEEEFEISRPHQGPRFYQFIMRHKVEHALTLLGEPVAGSQILICCCGSGMDAELLAERGAKAVGIDVSLGALRRAQARTIRYGVRIHLIRADAERLPFSAASFDYVFVHDGLHHLGDPFMAMNEMARVARRGVIVVEPASAAISNVAARFRLLPTREDAGNVIHRFRTDELASQFTSVGLPHWKSARYLIRYGHPPGRWWHVFDGRLSFAIGRTLFDIICVRLLGRWGNKLSFVALR